MSRRPDPQETGPAAGPDQTGLPAQRADVPGATGTGTGQPPAADEVEQLRAHVADLQEKLASTGGGDGSTTGPGRRHGAWRPLVAGALMTVAAVLAPLAIVASWAHDEITDTDRYVESVAPLSSDPAVQSAVVDRVTGEIFTRLDVEAVTQEAVDALAAQGLPPRVAANLDALSVPIANGIRGFVTNQVTRIVESDAFDRAWEAANRAAHTQMVAVLTGEGTDSVDVSGGTVTLNLGPVIADVKQRLEDNGFGLASRIPEVDAAFTVFESDDLASAQDAVGALERLSRVLPVLALVLLAAAVWVARDRRRALIHAALAVAASMLLLGITLNAFRPIYLDAITSADLNRDAAAAVYDTLVEFIRLNLRAVLAVALAVALGAWLSGPSPSAVAVRRGVTRTTAAVRGRGEQAGLSTGPVGEAAYRYRTALRGLVIGLAVLVYVQTEYPTGALTVRIVVLAALALVVLELVARPPAVQPPVGPYPDAAQQRPADDVARNAPRS